MKTLLQRINFLVKEEKVLKAEKERRGENYNVFEIMHAQYDEVHTHSAVLASLLNPNGNHGCRSAFLRLFVDKLAKLTAEAEAPVVFDTDLQKCHTYVERSIGKVSSGSETGGRIDIVVESADKGKAIIIENKIYAHDTYKQLYRYKKYADGRYGVGNYILLYLTLDGHEPEESSISGKDFAMTDGKDFHCVSYRTFIYEWLKCCKEKAASVPIVRETITQYHNLITKLTNQNMETSMKKELVDLLASKENITAIFKINRVYNNVINKVLNSILTEQVQEIAKELKMECKCPSNVNWFERWIGQFTFYKQEWKHFGIGFEFMGKDLKDFNYGVRYKSETEKGKTPDIKEIIHNKLSGESNEWWASYKPFKYPDWNNDTVFEHLYNGQIKAEIKQNVEHLLDCLKDIEL